MADLAHLAAFNPRQTRLHSFEQRNLTGVVGEVLGSPMHLPERRPRPRGPLVGPVQIVVQAGGFGHHRFSVGAVFTFTIDVADSRLNAVTPVPDVGTLVPTTPLDWSQATNVIFAEPR